MEYYELGIWLLLTLATLAKGNEKTPRDVSRHFGFHSAHHSGYHSGYVYQKPDVPLELPEKINPNYDDKNDQQQEEQQQPQQQQPQQPHHQQQPHQHHQQQPEQEQQHHKQRPHRPHQQEQSPKNRPTQESITEEVPEKEEPYQNPNPESITEDVLPLEEDHSETHQDGRVTVPDQETDPSQSYRPHLNRTDPYLPPSSQHHYLPPKPPKPHPSNYSPKHHPDQINLLEETKNNPSVQFLYKFDPNGEFKKLKRNPSYSEGSGNVKNIADILKKIKKDKNV